MFRMNLAPRLIEKQHHVLKGAKGLEDHQIFKLRVKHFYHLCVKYILKKTFNRGKPADERQHSLIQFTPFLRSVNPH